MGYFATTPNVNEWMKAMRKLITTFPTKKKGKLRWKKVKLRSQMRTKRCAANVLSFFFVILFFSDGLRVFLGGPRRVQWRRARWKHQFRFLRTNIGRRQRLSRSLARTTTKWDDVRNDYLQFIAKLRSQGHWKWAIAAVGFMLSCLLMPERCFWVCLDTLSVSDGDGLLLWQSYVISILFFWWFTDSWRKVLSTGKYIWIWQAQLITYFNTPDPQPLHCEANKQCLHSKKAFFLLLQNVCSLTKNKYRKSKHQKQQLQSDHITLAYPVVDGITLWNTTLEYNWLTNFIVCSRSNCK